MTTIWIDPAELTSMAATLRNLATAIENATASVTSTCCCSTPSAIAEYVNTELSCIEACGQTACSDFGADAADIANRAAQISADQSLATATSSAYGPGVEWGGLTTTWLGGMDSASATAPASFGTDWRSAIIGATTVGGAATYPLVGGGFGSAYGALSSVLSSQSDAVSTILAPSGLTYSNGQYEDSGGDRNSSLSGAYIRSDGSYDL